MSHFKNEEEKILPFGDSIEKSTVVEDKQGSLVFAKLMFSFFSSYLNMNFFEFVPSVRFCLMPVPNNLSKIHLHEFHLFFLE
jgi:hypothetical protein